MTEEKNVGTLDGLIRIILGVICIATLAYHGLVASILPIWGIVVLVILVPLFLKTGITHVCPIMKALGISTRKS